jgi:hypothetical protein
MTPLEDEVLARALRGQVDGLTEAPFTVGDVAGRARRIRRSRRIAGVVGGVAVAAMALPAGLMSGSMFDRSDAPPVLTQGPSPTQEAEPTDSAELTPVPEELDLSITGLPTGEPPQVGWFEDDGVVYLSDGSNLVLPSLEDPHAGTTVTELGANLVLGISDNEHADREVVVVTRDGEILSSDPADGSPVLSEDGSAAAYVRPGGTPVVLTNGGLDSQTLERTPAKTPVIVALTGSSCPTDCTVWVDDVTGRPSSYRVDSTGVSEVRTTTLVGAAHGDRYLGRLSLRDTYTVDGLWTGDATEPDWQAENLVGFSSDGQWVVSQLSDGLGGVDLLILDAETGEPQVAWRKTTAQGATALGEPVWEDGTHLLQVLSQGRDVVIARFGLDGSLELTGVRQRVNDPMEATLSLVDR